MKKIQEMFRAAVVLGLVPIVTVQPSLAWGVDGHHMINRLAGQTLPSDVPAFLRSEGALRVVRYGRLRLRADGTEIGPVRPGDL